MIKTYNEFKKTYKYMVKKYPNTTQFYQSENIIGTCLIEHYEKDGRKWVLVDSKTENVTNYYYCNTIDAIPFFKNLGGREKVTTAYTIYGCIPVTIESINPSNTEKTIRRFSFN